MATPSLDAYRQLNPQDTRPDTEVVPELISRLGEDVKQYPDLLEYATNLDREYRQAHRPGIVKEGINALISGAATGKAQLYSATAQAGAALDAPSIENFGLQGYQESLQNAAPYSPTVGSVGDVHSPTDALYYGVGLAGSQAAPVAATIGTSAVGSAIGMATGGPPGAVAGGIIGAAGAGYLQSQNYAPLALSGAQDPLLTSAAVGAAGGLLMTIVPSKIFRAAFGAEAQSLAGMGVEQLLARAEKTVPGLSQSIIHGVGEHGLNNSLLGVGNELVSMAGELYAHRDDPNFEITDKEITDRILNGAVAGGALGAIFGAAGAPGERSKELQIKEFAKARAKELQDRKVNALTNFITPKDPYAGLEGAHEPTDETSPFDAALMDSQHSKDYAAYAELFDDLADPDRKAAARARYETQRQTSFTHSAYAYELLKQQLRAEQGLPPEEPGASPQVPVATPEPPSAPQSISGFKTSKGSTYVVNEDGTTTRDKAARPEHPGIKEVGPQPKSDITFYVDDWGLSSLGEIQAKGGPKAELAPVGDERGRWGVRYLEGKDAGKFEGRTRAPVFKEPAVGLYPVEIWKDGAIHFGNQITELHPEKASETTNSAPTSTQLPGVIDAPGALEHGGDIPLEPDVAPRTVVPESVPELRKESRMVPSGAFPDEVEALSQEGIRKDETTKKNTKRMVAVKDNASGRVTLYPVYRSTGNRTRIDNGVEARVNSRRALANALGLDEQAVAREYRQGGATRAALDKVWTELSAGAKEDQYLSELLAEKDGDKQKYTVLGFLDSTEPIEGKHYTFDSEERFRDETRYVESEKIVTKGNKGGGQGVPQVLERLNKIAPRDSRALQILASVLETLPDLEAQAHEETRESGKRSVDEQRRTSDAGLLIRGLLTSGKNLRAEVFMEKLKTITRPEQLFNMSKGHYFGLFTPDQWNQFKALTEMPNVSALDLVHAVEQGLESYGWKSKYEYLRAITPQEGEKQSGAQLRENDASKPDDEDNLSAQVVEQAGREGSHAVMQAAENALPDSDAAHQDLPVNDEKSAKEVLPDRAQGFVGLSEIESEGLIHRLTKAKSEAATIARDILDARADSEISNPKDDLEFQAIKKDLAGILNKIFDLSRPSDFKPELTDEFLYGVYSNLDKIVRDSNPKPSTYRVSNDAIQRTFHNTVAWLGDKGVDVRLVQQAVDSQVEFLRNEWGRSISHEDGRRLVVVTMADLSEPSRDNLRVLMHEVAHQQFADEPVWIQRLLHESVDRMNDLQLDVFSKTRDSRLADTYTGRQFAEAGMPTGPKITLKGPEFLEEVLAEHLSNTGVKADEARTLTQRFIGALQKVFARAMLAFSQLRGNVISPKWALKYMELRFQDMLDKTVSPKTDFETLTGTQRNTAKFQGTWYKQVGGDFNVERYDSASGQFILHDVVDESKLAAELNLDNKLSFSDVVIRDSREKNTKEIWGRVFGVSDKTTPLKIVLDKLTTSLTTGAEYKAFAKGIRDFLEASEGQEPTIKFATDEDISRLTKSNSLNGPGVYFSDTHQILIRPELVSGYIMDEAASLILHEAQHAVTSRALGAYEIYKTARGSKDSKAAVVSLIVHEDTVEHYGGLSEAALSRRKKRIVEAMVPIEKADKIFQFLKDNPTLKGEYGTTNLDEFLSETLSNRGFQMKLASIQLPEKLRVVSKARNIFQTMVKLFAQLFTGAPEGNALESAINVTSDIMRVADPISIRNRGGLSFWAAPVSEAESDARVQKDFEYEFAEHNSQADFYHKLFDKPATDTKMGFDGYLKKILGIYNPEESIRQLETKLGARSRPIPVNQDLRLNDSKGTGNRVESVSDRAQLTKRLYETISTAQGKLVSKMMSLKDLVPRLEKEHTRAIDRLVRFETMLHDITAIRDNALKVLRKGLRGAERNAARLVQWSARHEGLGGIAADFFRVGEEDAIPADYADLLWQSVDEHADDFFITDALTAAQKYGVDFDALAPREIEKRIQEIVRSTKDETLTPLADNSPQARADLALLTYYAKTAPEDMAALEIRVEKDPERKDAILKTIQKIIRGNYEDTGGLNDLFKDVRKGDVKVGKAKQALTTAMRQLNQNKKNLLAADLRAREMEKASIVLKEAVKPLQADLGVHASRFEPYDGAKILLTPDVPNEHVFKGTLKLGPDSAADVNAILMDNIRWLKSHDLQDTTWHAVADQIEGLKKVAGEQIDRDFKDSSWTKRMGSIPERLNNIGLAILRRAGDRIIRYHGQRTSVDREIQRGYGVTEDYKAAMKATGFENSYSGYKEAFFNPAFHFLKHLTLIPGVTETENRQYAKEQLKLFFMRNDRTRELVTKPGAYDAIWKSLESNARSSKDVANKAAEWRVFVDDPDIKVENPRTGKIENAQRPAMDVGLMTTQSSITKIFGVKDLLETVKDQNGEGVWSKWAQTDEPVDPKVLFTDDVLHHFVRPFIYDTGTLHLNAPELLDGKTKNKANPLNVQNAFDGANGDMVKFASDLFDLEYTLQNEPTVDAAARKKAYVASTLEFFKKQYLKIYRMSEAQEQFNKRGLTTDTFLASPMMDSVKAMDFPPEFVDYHVYDHTTLRNTLSQLAAHAAMGRDLGLFSGQKDPNGGIMWELNHAEIQLRQEQAEYTRLAAQVKRENPNASVKEIDAGIAKAVGKEKLEKFKGIPVARAEIRKAEQEIMSYLMSPNGATRDMQVAQSVVGGLAGMMVNNFKSALNQIAQTFEPFMSYGIGKTGWRQAMRTLEATGRSGAGSLVQAVSGQAYLASKMARFMAEHGLGIDPANEVTSSQVMADTGKNNVYEDKKLLGWLRKGRSLAFDTGFRGAEGERIAPKFRPQAPFSMMAISENQGAIEAELLLYNDVLNRSMQVMKETLGATTDPKFQFTHEQINMGDNTFDTLAFEELKNEFRIMGTTMEVEARSLIESEASGKPLGEIVVPPTLARLIAGEALRRMSLPNDISSAPIWMQNSSLGRLAMPLISWSLNKTNQIVGALREPNGEASRRAMVAGIATLALGMVPAAVAVSLILDQYDENVLSKKSNLVGFNFDSPSQTAVALMERVGRVGTFGMAGDLVNGVRVYGTSGDLRGISVDQRVVFVNTLMSLIGLASTAYNQEGTLTYDTFYRPLINTFGGGGILQNQQIFNNITNSVMGVPVFTAEAETTARLNATNYLRGAGRVTGLDVKTSSGQRSMPTPIKPWVSEMSVAAYSGDSQQFVEAYRKAILAAQEEGKPDPADYVKRAFEAQHPLRATFATPPTKVEVAQMIGTLSDKGKQDVTRALEYFNAYSASLGIKPYDGKENVAKVKGAGPSPWGGSTSKNLWQPAGL